MDNKRLDLPIGGMNCAGCAARIEKELQNLPGVQEAAVNFAAEQATLRYDPATLSPEQIINKVVDIGYQVRLQRLTIPVAGMHCASCAATIERALRGVEGVVEAHVNFGTEKATVAYVPRQVEPASLRQAIKDAGYEPLEVKTAEAEGDRERDARQTEIRNLKRKLVVSVVLSLPIFLGSMRAMFP